MKITLIDTMGVSTVIWVHTMPMADRVRFICKCLRDTTVMTPNMIGVVPTPDLARMLLPYWRHAVDVFSPTLEQGLRPRDTPTRFTLDLRGEELAIRIMVGHLRRHFDRANPSRRYDAICGAVLTMMPDGDEFTKYSNPTLEAGAIEALIELVEARHKRYLSNV